MNQEKEYFAHLKEDVNVELKEASNKVPDSFYETYSSFANTHGGTIYLGIKEGAINTICGVMNPEEQKKNIISALHSKEKVSYCLISDENIQILDVDGKRIIKVFVPEAPKETKPIYIKGNLLLSYERIGDGDFLLTENAITSLLIERRKISFDAMPNALGFDFSRIDVDSLKAYREELNKQFPNNIYKNYDDHKFLSKIGALKTEQNGRELLTNGAVFFFGYIADIMQISTNFFLDYRENITENSRWDFRLTSDDLSWNANLYNFFRIVAKRLTKNLPNPFKTNGFSNNNGEDLKRAIIEAIVNAISNQDLLSLPGITIEKKTTSIKIENSGDIPTGLPQAIRGGVSNPRNTNIINYFRIIQVADRAGYGVPSIFECFESYHFPKPELTTERNPLRTILNLGFMQLSSHVPYHNEKVKILTTLEEHPEGLSTSELATIIDKKNTVTTQILNELLATSLVRTNGKKTKGRKFFKR